MLGYDMHPIQDRQHRNNQYVQYHDRDEELPIIRIFVTSADLDTFMR